MNKQEIAIEELRLGMYVVELDRPWLGTPFPFQGFPLTSPEQIEHLRSCCKSVYVDPEREEWKPAPRAGGAVAGTTAYAEVHTVDEEMPLAREVYQTCEAALSELQKSLQGQGAIQPATLKAAVRKAQRSFRPK